MGSGRFLTYSLPTAHFLEELYMSRGDALMKG